MIEIPESRTLGHQITQLLAGHTISSVFNATQPHKFAWFSGNPLDYPALLTGRKFLSAKGYGQFVDILLDQQVHITIDDGANVRYYAPGVEIPKNYQLLIGMEDDSFLVVTVAMYGGILAYRGELSSPYFEGAVVKLSPLDARFDWAYFEALGDSCSKSLSVKAFLATQQRIPGLGNGVLQDILFSAGIHPKRKFAQLSSSEARRLFDSVKAVLADMTAKGGRDTEKDLLGNPGGYRTLLSKNTYGDPCPICGDRIVKEAYMGGAVYYCPCCQPMK